MPNMCQSTTSLQKFLSYLDADKISVSENKVTILAGVGPVEWVYLEIFNMWAIGGNFIYCLTVGIAA